MLLPSDGRYWLKGWYRLLSFPPLPMENETLVYYGGPVKAMNDDEKRIGGYSVRFGSGNARDLDGQYFSAKTYLGNHDGDGIDVMLNHGIPLSPELKHWSKVFLPPVKAKRDHVGIFVETVVKLNQQYRDMLADKYGLTDEDFDRWEDETYAAVKSGALGWSSGSAQHALDWDDATGEITVWPIIEHSLTPMQANPPSVVVPLKSLAQNIASAPIEHVIRLDEQEYQEYQAWQNTKTAALARILNGRINEMATGDTTRSAIIAQMASAAGIEAGTVSQILNNEIDKPPRQRLAGFAQALSLSLPSLLRAAGYDDTKMAARQEAHPSEAGRSPASMDAGNAAQIDTQEADADTALLAELQALTQLLP